MSDISIQFGPFDYVVLAILFGWPGLILGGALGALLWKRRRILGAVLGALALCLGWAAVRVLML